jgi:hypothetical protein
MLRTPALRVLPLCLGALVISNLGCAEERTPISRVQANALAKSFFVGDLVDQTDNPEFYMRTTVIDAAVGAGADGLFTSSDAQPVSRIRWQINEKVLLARLTYELVEDTDHKGARRVPDGQVVAAYTIEKHFDIRRDYNPATGEENNVISENDTDLPGTQRQYFRVDWSRNLITDAYSLDALSQLGMYYGVKWDALAYYVSDPSQPGRAGLRRGSRLLRRHQQGLRLAGRHRGRVGGPSRPAGSSAASPRRAAIRARSPCARRSSRWWTTTTSPSISTGPRMDIFGWFTNDRFGYDRRYGVVDDRWHRFASRWNVFERSHVSPLLACNTPETTPVGKDPHRDEDEDGTEDECKSVGRGSRCDDIRRRVHDPAARSQHEGHRRGT